MHEFRPADVIDQDTRLAESLIDGDLDALGTLVVRYGRAVGAVLASSSDAARADRPVEVFVEAWRDRENLEAGTDFAPWLGGIAADVAGRPAAEVDDTWVVAMAIEAVDTDARAVLRAHHVDGGDLPEHADRHERRLRRRLAHLGTESAIVEALGDPQPWSDPDSDLMEQVRSRLRIGDDPPDDAPADPVGETAPVLDRTHEGGVVPERPGLITRSLRPVLLGLAGAVTVLFVAIVALSAASGSADPIAFTAELTPTGAILDVEGGELTVTERDNGLRFDLDAPTLPRRAGGLFYEGVLVLQDGTEVGVGTFNEGVNVTLSGASALDRVDQFLVVARELGSDVADVVLKLDVPDG